MPYVPDIVSAMHMRCIHAAVQGRPGEPNLLPGTRYMVTQMHVYAAVQGRPGEPNLLPGTRYVVTQMHVYAMTGRAWQSACRVGCAICALVPFLSTVCPFL